MGLTVVEAVPNIDQQIKELTEYFESQIQNLKEEIQALQNVVFEGIILNEKDATWEVVRKKRDYLLKVTDWTMTPGSTVDQQSWATYRQILRDLPQTYGEKNLKSLVWPKAPSASGPNKIKKEKRVK